MVNYSLLFNSVGFIWAVLSLFLLAFAWSRARKGVIRQHKLLMIILTCGGWLFIVLYLLRYSLSESRPEIVTNYIPWFAFHGTLGLIPLIGATLMVCSRIYLSAGHFNRHHAYYGRIFIILWVFTHLGGIFNIWLLK